MSISSKIESFSRPLQTGGYTVALPVAGVMARQVLVYCVIVDFEFNRLSTGR